VIVFNLQKSKGIKSVIVFNLQKSKGIKSVIVFNLQKSNGIQLTVLDFPSLHIVSIFHGVSWNERN